MRRVERETLLNEDKKLVMKIFLFLAHLLKRNPLQLPAGLTYVVSLLEEERHATHGIKAEVTLSSFY
jgi:hypothetical protein